MRHERQCIGYPIKDHNEQAKDDRSTNTHETNTPATPVADEQAADEQAADGQPTQRNHAQPPSDVHQEQTHPEQAVVAPSLIWRFVGWLGGLTLSLEQAREMLLHRDSNSTCHRISGHVEPGKARSEERLRTLESARQLLLIMPEWEGHFGGRFFPQFATRSGFD